MSQFNSVYVAQATYATVYAAILKLAPICGECNEPTGHICLEECCSDPPIFCHSCTGGDHFCHLTNELSALFISKQTVVDSDNHSKETLTNTL